MIITQDQAINIEESKKTITTILMNKTLGFYVFFSSYNIKHEPISFINIRTFIRYHNILLFR
jgi:hypothetical protein